jgi:hypothetical protein
MMIGTIVLPSLMVKGKIALRKVDLKTYANFSLVIMMELGIILSTEPTTPLLSMRTEVGHFLLTQNVNN